ncbi:bifunctional chorismate-binding protein/class IV aminotransferase [Campylobacter estrildidarum]|uniref:Bifunctional aminodeoxychorismate synthase component I/aminotransferase n=1 Tax=Campylobacter estrildidarum TaxID=2510189 RepID=A0A4U7BL17_9BACT|nr:bifunctional anthranilate synthase component I family protein/class IV aminotransferase [Campylobacter estrildidarum]TKX30965.1 bifunctional aminodeoxychorismate synthase component I/aminotransferase [Campylobacter estrildidarum]
MNAENFAIFGKYLYYDLKYTLRAYNQKQSKKCFKFVEKYKDKFYFITLVDYEFYKYLYDRHFKSKKSYLVFFVYKKRKKFSILSIDEDRFLPSFYNGLNFQSYKENFLKVKEAIAKGQSYQVNLTQNFHFETLLDGFSLFNLLLKRQNTTFRAYIKYKDREILSFSPELFFKTKKNTIITKPMKGTIKRDKDPKKDKENKLFLKNDIKNLSENVMITDLLRNDLSKLIKKQSMKVKLFKIQSYPTLHQMTSIIKGSLKKNIDYYKIFKALFPCGSITGAPKIETIKLIENLEKRKRGIYCGSIGLIHKNKSKFSVAIRTLEKRENYQYSVGGGLVWDSNLNDEFDELKLKAKFLMSKDFFLFETMYYKNGKILFFKQHLQRLLNSAIKLGFNIQILLKEFSQILQEKADVNEFLNLSIHKLNKKLFLKEHNLFYTSKLKTKHKQAIVKLILKKSGDYCISYHHIKDNTNNTLVLSKEKLNSKSDFLYHKSSIRKLYEDKASLWKNNSCYDIAFFNEKNELCEGSRSNILINKNGIFYTPTLNSGLLDGIYRSFLTQLKLIKEKTLFKQDLLEADEIYCINSVRGLKKVSLE